MINECLAEKKWKQADLVRASGLPHKTISRLCRESGGITVRTAIKLEKALDKPSSFWLELQTDYVRAKKGARK